MILSPATRVWIRFTGRRLVASPGMGEQAWGVAGIGALTGGMLAVAPSLAESMAPAEIRWIAIRALALILALGAWYLGATVWRQDEVDLCLPQRPVHEPLIWLLTAFVTVATLLVPMVFALGHGFAAMRELPIAPLWPLRLGIAAALLALVPLAVIVGWTALGSAMNEPEERPARVLGGLVVFAGLCLGMFPEVPEAWARARGPAGDEILDPTFLGQLLAFAFVISTLGALLQYRARATLRPERLVRPRVTARRAALTLLAVAALPPLGALAAKTMAPETDVPLGVGLGLFALLTLVGMVALLRPASDMRALGTQGGAAFSRTLPLDRPRRIRRGYALSAAWMAAVVVAAGASAGLLAGLEIIRNGVVLWGMGALVVTGVCFLWMVAQALHLFHRPDALAGGLIIGAGPAIVGAVIIIAQLELVGIWWAALQFAAWMPVALALTLWADRRIEVPDIAVPTRVRNEGL